MPACTRTSPLERVDVEHVGEPVELQQHAVAAGDVAERVPGADRAHAHARARRVIDRL